MTRCQKTELRKDEEQVSKSETCTETVTSTATQAADDNPNPSTYVENNDGYVSKRPRRACRDREYNLRDSSLINRIETERRRLSPKNPKPKAKPPPLSKYRRKTANARERTRMKEINDAFDELRKTIPASQELEDVQEQTPADMKLTKITTLRLALNYIRALRDVLGYDNGIFNNGSVASNSGSTSGSYSDASSSSDSTNSPEPSIQCSSPESSSEELTMTLRTCDLLGSMGTPSPEIKVPPHSSVSLQRNHSPLQHKLDLPVADFILQSKPCSS